ncbi:Gfo/Idh/MocA family oxidoreductase [Maribacter sp. MAR_2009_72]|uniref:Gfo/Idh/MocA family oxidoreductase n=1 Tax=Maribacter sp. MAR_2009_72 TaxID=1250050 RepID=UPI00119A2CCA|nr:Gfo/Idh/MocA family oxidoreductase [Maribacter sp. MAR_2009_72]TVZ17262.1 oxidoreductase family protein [Maribacter sp. MAR_2009_72]
MNNTRRKFITSIGMLAASSAFPISTFAFNKTSKLKVALVGTGIRGTTFWGKRLVDEYGEILEFVGLSDINSSRLKYAMNYIGADCPLFTDFEEMIQKTEPDLVIVTTKDSTHHEYIIKGLEMGCDVLTEKPLTTDESKCQEIIDAEKKSDKKLIVGFNYRWSPYATKIKELISNKTIGDLVSVDFHWYLNTYHGASYFRRWHGEMESSGSLWVHKSTHHFDLLNWWINSEPKEVFAYGDLEFYGKNGPQRGPNCRSCDHKSTCEFYWDITKDESMKKLYADHEHEDGYIRDNCLFRNEIDIYDKMSAQVKYADNTVVNYSLTTYSPFEGWRVSFNGTKGRIEASEDIPYHSVSTVSEAEKHALEMAQNNKEEENFGSIVVHKLWEKHEVVNVPIEKGGHGGGDKRLHDKIFVNPETTDPYGRTAGIRDGAMSVLIGIGARRSIESGKPIKIGDLTDLEPKKIRS